MKRLPSLRLVAALVGLSALAPMASAQWVLADVQHEGYCDSTGSPTGITGYAYGTSCAYPDLAWTRGTAVSSNFPTSATTAAAGRRFEEWCYSGPGVGRARAEAEAEIPAGYLRASTGEVLQLASAYAKADVEIEIHSPIVGHIDLRVFSILDNTGGTTVQIFVLNGVPIPLLVGGSYVEEVRTKPRRRARRRTMCIDDFSVEINTAAASTAIADGAILEGAIAKAALPESKPFGLFYVPWGGPAGDGRSKRVQVRHLLTLYGPCTSPQGEGQ